MPRYLTLDLGTTYFKATLFDESGEPAHLARLPLRIEHPHPGWWELPAGRFEQHVTQLLGELRVQSPTGFEGVAAVSFATQTNTICLLDREDRPLTPMVIWLDERALALEPELAKLTASMDHPRLTGVPRLAGQFTPAKLLYWSQALPQWRDTARLCLISDLLTLWFTGEHVTEAGTAGLTGMLDIHELRWLEPFADACGLPPTALAQVARAGTEVGAIRSEVAQAFGLPGDCRFVVGCLDQYAGAIGAGNVMPGTVSETTGTVLATVRCADGFDTDPPAGVFQGPSFDPQRYYQMVFGSVSANLLEAYRNSLDGAPSFAELDALAAAVPPGAGGVTLAETHDVTDVTTFFEGVPACGAATRAILEAVAFALHEQVSQLCDDDWPEAIRSVGGAARSALWRRIKANVLECPVIATECPEPTSLGAALLAASAHRDEPIASLAEAWVKVCDPERPTPSEAAAYRQLLERRASVS